MLVFQRASLPSTRSRGSKSPRPSKLSWTRTHRNSACGARLCLNPFRRHCTIPGCHEVAPRRSRHKINVPATVSAAPTVPNGSTKTGMLTPAIHAVPTNPPSTYSTRRKPTQGSPSATRMLPTILMPTSVAGVFSVPDNAPDEQRGQSFDERTAFPEKSGLSCQLHRCTKGKAPSARSGRWAAACGWLSLPGRRYYDA